MLKASQTLAVLWHRSMNAINIMKFISSCNESYVSFSIIAIQHCAILDIVVPTNRAIFRNVRGNSVSPCDTRVLSKSDLQCPGSYDYIRIIYANFVILILIHTHIWLLNWYYFPASIPWGDYLKSISIKALYPDKDSFQSASLHLRPSDAVVYLVHSLHQMYCLRSIMAGSLVPAKRKYGPDVAEGFNGYIRYGCKNVS